MTTKGSTVRSAAAVYDPPPSPASIQSFLKAWERDLPTLKSTNDSKFQLQHLALQRWVTVLQDQDVANGVVDRPWEWHTRQSSATPTNNLTVKTSHIAHGLLGAFTIKQAVTLKEYSKLSRKQKAATSSSDSILPSNWLAPYPGFILTDTQYAAFPLSVSTAVEAPWLKHSGVDWLIVGDPQSPAAQANHVRFQQRNAQFAWNRLGSAIKLPKTNLPNGAASKFIGTKLVPGIVSDHHLYFTAIKPLDADIEVTLFYGADFWKYMEQSCCSCFKKVQTFDKTSSMQKCAGSKCKVGYHHRCYNVDFSRRIPLDWMCSYHESIKLDSISQISQLDPTDIDNVTISSGLQREHSFMMAPKSPQLQSLNQSPRCDLTTLSASNFHPSLHLHRKLVKCVRFASPLHSPLVTPIIPESPICDMSTLTSSMFQARLPLTTPSGSKQPFEISASTSVPRRSLHLQLNTAATPSSTLRSASFDEESEAETDDMQLAFALSLSQASLDRGLMLNDKQLRTCKEWAQNLCYLAGWIYWCSVPADGDCLFHAFLHAWLTDIGKCPEHLLPPIIMPTSVIELRKFMAVWIRQNVSVFRTITNDPNGTHQTHRSESDGTQKIDGFDFLLSQLELAGEWNMIWDASATRKDPVWLFDYMPTLLAVAFNVRISILRACAAMESSSSRQEIDHFMTIEPQQWIANRPSGAAHICLVQEGGRDHWAAVTKQIPSLHPTLEPEYHPAGVIRAASQRIHSAFAHPHRYDAALRDFNSHCYQKYCSMLWHLIEVRASHYLIMNHGIPCELGAFAVKDIPKDTFLCAYATNLTDQPPPIKHSNEVSGTKTGEAQSIMRYCHARRIQGAGSNLLLDGGVVASLFRRYVAASDEQESIIRALPAKAFLPLPSDYSNEILQLFKQLAIGCMINSPVKNDHINVSMVNVAAVTLKAKSQLEYGGYLFIKTLRAVKKGEELLCRYNNNEEKNKFRTDHEARDKPDSHQLKRVAKTAAKVAMLSNLTAAAVSSSNNGGCHLNSSAVEDELMPEQSDSDHPMNQTDDDDHMESGTDTEEQRESRQIKSAKSQHIKRAEALQKERNSFNHAYMKIYQRHYADLRLRRSADSMKKLRLSRRLTVSARSTDSVKVKTKRRNSTAHFADLRQAISETGPLAQELQWEEELQFAPVARAHTLFETYEAIRSCCIQHSERDQLERTAFLQLPFRMFAGPDSFIQERLRIAMLPAGVRTTERVNLLSQFRCRIDREKYVTLTNRNALHVIGSVPLCFQCTYRMYGVEGKTFDRDRAIAFSSGSRPQGIANREVDRPRPQRQTAMTAFMAVVAQEGETMPHLNATITIPGVSQKKAVMEKIQNYIRITSGMNDDAPVVMPSYTTIQRAINQAGLTVRTSERTTLGKCNYCVAIDGLLQSSNLSHKQRREVLELREKHLNDQKSQRFAAYRFGAEAQLNESSSLHIGIDGMDQAKVSAPHVPRSTKTELSALTIKLMGVHVEGGAIPAMAFLCFQDVRGDANLNCEVLARALRLTFAAEEAAAKSQNRQPNYPRHLRMSMDNATNANKNFCFFAYLALLVNQEVFDSVELVFYLPGHGHCKLDQMFSRFSLRLNHFPVFTVEQLAAELKAAYQPTVKSHQEAQEAIRVLANDSNAPIAEMALPEIKCGNAGFNGSAGCPKAFRQISELVKHRSKCTFVRPRIRTAEEDGSCSWCAERFADINEEMFNDPIHVIEAAHKHHLVCKSAVTGNDESLSESPGLPQSLNHVIESLDSTSTFSSTFKYAGVPELYTSVVSEVADCQSWLAGSIKTWHGITKPYVFRFHRSNEANNNSNGDTILQYRRLVTNDPGVEYDANNMESTLETMILFEKNFIPKGEPRMLPPLLIDQLQLPKSYPPFQQTDSHEDQINHIVAGLVQTPLGKALGFSKDISVTNQWPYVYRGLWPPSAKNLWNIRFCSWAERTAALCTECRELQSIADVALRNAQAKRSTITSTLPDGSTKKNQVKDKDCEIALTKARANLKSHLSECTPAEHWWWADADQCRTRFPRPREIELAQCKEHAATQSVISAVQDKILRNDVSALMNMEGVTRERASDRNQPISVGDIVTTFGTDTSAPFAVAVVERVIDQDKFQVCWYEPVLSKPKFNEFNSDAIAWWTEQKKSADSIAGLHALNRSLPYLPAAPPGPPDLPAPALEVDESQVAEPAMHMKTIASGDDDDISAIGTHDEDNNDEYSSRIAPIQSINSMDDEEKSEHTEDDEQKQIQMAIEFSEKEQITQAHLAEMYKQQEAACAFVDPMTIATSMSLSLSTVRASSQNRTQLELQECTAWAKRVAAKSNWTHYQPTIGDGNCMLTAFIHTITVDGSAAAIAAVPVDILSLRKYMAKWIREHLDIFRHVTSDPAGDFSGSIPIQENGQTVMKPANLDDILAQLEMNGKWRMMWGHESDGFLFDYMPVLLAIAFNVRISLILSSTALHPEAKTKDRIDCLEPHLLDESLPLQPIAEICLIQEGAADHWSAATRNNPSVPTLALATALINKSQVKDLTNVTLPMTFSEALLLLFQYDNDPMDSAVMREKLAIMSECGPRAIQMLLTISTIPKERQLKRDLSNSSNSSTVNSGFKDQTSISSGTFSWNKSVRPDSFCSSQRLWMLQQQVLFLSLLPDATTVRHTDRNGQMCVRSPRLCLHKEVLRDSQLARAKNAPDFISINTPALAISHPAEGSIKDDDMKLRELFNSTDISKDDYVEALFDEAKMQNSFKAYHLKSDSPSVGCWEVRVCSKTQESDIRKKLTSTIQSALREHKMPDLRLTTSPATSATEPKKEYGIFLSTMMLNQVNSTMHAAATRIMIKTTQHIMDLKAVGPFVRAKAKAAPPDQQQRYDRVLQLCPGGFGPYESQTYAKGGFTFTGLHDEIADSAALNIATSSSRGISIWIGISLRSLVNRQGDQENKRVLRDKFEKLILEEQPNSADLLHTVFNDSTTAPLLVFQLPGDIIVSPSGIGAAHAVLAVGDTLNIAINVATSPKAVDDCMRFWEDANPISINSALATKKVFPGMWLKDIGGWPLQHTFWTEQLESGATIIQNAQDRCINQIDVTIYTRTYETSERHSDKRFCMNEILPNHLLVTRSYEKIPGCGSEILWKSINNLCLACFFHRHSLFNWPAHSIVACAYPGMKPDLRINGCSTLELPFPLASSIYPNLITLLKVPRKRKHDDGSSSSPPPPPPQPPAIPAPIRMNSQSWLSRTVRSCLACFRWISCFHSASNSIETDNDSSVMERLLEQQPSIQLRKAIIPESQSMYNYTQLSKLPRLPASPGGPPGIPTPSSDEEEESKSHTDSQPAQVRRSSRTGASQSAAAAPVSESHDSESNAEDSDEAYVSQSDSDDREESISKQVATLPHKRKSTSESAMPAAAEPAVNQATNAKRRKTNAGRGAASAVTSETGAVGLKRFFNDDEFHPWSQKLVKETINWKWRKITMKVAKDHGWAIGYPNERFYSSDIVRSEIAATMSASAGWRDATQTPRLSRELHAETMHSLCRK